MREEEFINIFNENYPFERYILKEPVQVNSIFDDLLLTEIFVPETKIKPIIIDGQFVGHTEMPWNEIYIKVKPKWHHQSMRLSFYDFAEHIRDEIEWAVIKDFGQYEWECLYIEFDEPSDEMLLQALQTQYNLIKLNYNECKIKNISCTDVLNICEKLCENLIKINDKIMDFIVNNKERFDFIPEIGSIWEIEQEVIYPNVNNGNPVIELKNNQNSWLRLPKELICGNVK